MLVLTGRTTNNTGTCYSITQENKPIPNQADPPTVKGEEQISAMRCLRAASTDGAGTYDGAEPSCA